MTVFVLRKKGGYFAAKARVKTRNFEECLGLGRHLLRCRKAASSQACALRLLKCGGRFTPFDSGAFAKP